MTDLQTDVAKMDLLWQDSFGLESFSTSTKVKDFLSYYTHRFFNNVQHAFKDFSTSELADFNKKRSNALKDVFKRPVNALGDEIFPIPKGMVYSYTITLSSLERVLTDIKQNSLFEDLGQILLALQTGYDIPHASIFYSKETFEKNKQEIGELFSQSGPTHLLFKDVLKDLHTVSDVNTRMNELTKIMYQDVFRIRKDVMLLEKISGDTKLSGEDVAALKKAMMSMAYRLTIFAIVADHIQAIEHNFVKCLTKIYNTYDKT